MIKMTVKKNEAGQRFDKLLMKKLKEAPASFVYKMLRKKNITLNGLKASGTEKVEEGDEICFFLSDETYAKFSSSANDKESENVKKDGNAVLKLLKEEIIYEDNDIIIVNKPAGELSQKACASDVSLNERIVGYLKKESTSDEAFTPSICNRIDRNTSGLILAGKSLVGLQDGAEILKKHTLKKYYLCITQGVLTKCMSLNAYIFKDEKTNKVSVSDKEKEGYEKIAANYFPLCTGKGYSLIAVQLITGKTHQIRAHLSYLGFPLAGDYKYGYKKNDLINVKYQLLHAFMLVFPKNCLRLNEAAGRTVYVMPPVEFADMAKALFTEKEYLNAVMEFQRSQGFQP